MQVRLLGAHNLETKDTRHTCFLIDGVLGIDAGSLATGLTAAEINGMQALLLTHHHFDHTRDVPTLGLARRDARDSLSLHGLPETLDAVRVHLMDGDIYPDMTMGLNDDPPRYVTQAAKPWSAFSIGSHEVRAVPVPHPVPAVGYVVRSQDGHVVAFTGDTGGELRPFFEDPWRPEVLFVDMTFPERLRELAELTGHLTPGLLKDQMAMARGSGAPLPKIIAVHRGLGTEAELLRELAHLKAELTIQLVPGYQGMVVQL